MVMPRNNSSFERPGSGWRESFSRGWLILKISFDVLKKHKSLMLFPLISLLTQLVLMAVLLGMLLVDGQAGAGSILAVFACFFLSYFIIVFFNVALAGSAIKALEELPVSVVDGLSMAYARLSKIIAWSVFSSVVGALFSLLENVSERFGDSISGGLQVGWSVICYFVLPVIVMEGLSPSQAIKRSASIIASSPKEFAVGSLSLVLLSLALFLPIFLIMGIASGAMEDSFIGLSYDMIVWVVVLIAYSLFVHLVVSTLKTIFASTLYAYAITSHPPSDLKGDTSEGPRSWP